MEKHPPEIDTRAPRMPVAELEQLGEALAGLWRWPASVGTSRHPQPRWGRHGRRLLVQGRGSCPVLRGSADE